MTEKELRAYIFGWANECKGIPLEDDINVLLWTMEEHFKSSPEPAASDTLEIIKGIALESPELNPSNYDHDQVCELNRAMCEICSLLRATPATQPDGGDENKLLLAIIERDRLIVCEAWKAINAALKGHEWLCYPDSGRGSYEYNDDNWKKEFGLAFEAVREAIKPLDKIRSDIKNCPPSQELAVKFVQALEQSLSAKAAEPGVDVEALKQEVANKLQAFPEPKINGFIVQTIDYLASTGRLSGGSDADKTRE